MSDETAGYWLERLTEAARSGEVLDLTEGVTESDLLNAATADRWPIERRVPADAIRATVLQQDLHPDPHGLRIRGADIVGALDLQHVTVPCPLHLENSRLQRDADLRGAHLVELNLAGTHTHVLVLVGAFVDGDVNAGALKTTGKVSASGAHIGGHLNLRQAVLTNEDLPHPASHETAAVELQAPRRHQEDARI